ncbi:MAG: ATP-dependent zinc metalloprotease FtsH [Clostridia bacterium]|nr:ATP-dependent zinc metalloprotease FtsH [Clostridia bacterium]
MSKKDIKKGLIPYLFLFLLILGIVYFYNVSNKKVNNFSYEQFINYLDESEVTEVTIVPRSSAGIYEIQGKLNGYDKNETFYLKAPLSDEVISQLLDAEKNYDFKINTKADPDSSTFLLFLVNILPMVLILGLGFYFVTRQMGSANKSMDFGRSRAKLNEDSNKITFEKVAGLDEEKEEVAELIDFLKNPKKFQRLGARIPKGVLLVGPPGTGKTLLARAVAGEANVPFYYISGSEFVELFVGVGASRVRDMFKQAKHNAPCLIFIDEIDAVGRQRGAGLGGGHDEREQTLNQLLVEMDGFAANQGVIVIAATNRPDILDNALLRPGRFDRQVVVDVPDMKGREAILKVHARNKKIDSSVDLSVIAKTTAGFTGADLANLLNEAALLAARYNLRTIGMEEIENAMIKIVVGTEKKTRVMSEKEKKLTAFHEAGHAIVSKLLPDQDPVHQISIIPRGRAGGYTMNLPMEDKSYTTKGDILASIMVLLGGRAAEQITLDDISTGASNDIQRATSAARQMVTKYGMSDSLGPVCYTNDHDEVFIGRDFVQSKSVSENVAAKIDAEVSKIISECYDKTINLINNNMEKLNNVAEALMKFEKISGEEFEKVFNGEQLPELPAIEN